MEQATEIFDDRVCELGEGPHFDDRGGRLYWIDVLGSRVLWRSVGIGADASPAPEHGEFPTPGHVGAAVPRVDGGLALCLPDGPALRDPDGTIRPLGRYADADADADGSPTAGADRPEIRSNDAKADPAGRLWLGTMAYDETPGAAALYRLHPGAERPERVLTGVTISNGLGWSPDGATMYYIDTPTGRVDAFDYEPSTGAATGRRALATVEEGAGSPDGLCVDAAGGVWVALYNGGAVRRYTADGELDRIVRLPTPLVTSCAFGGPGYDRLFITTAVQGRTGDPAAGLVYVHHPTDVVGRPADRFRP